MNAWQYGTIWAALTGTANGHSGIAGLDITGLFQPDATVSDNAAATLASAFLLALGSGQHPLAAAAREFLARQADRAGPRQPAAAFFFHAVHAVSEEVTRRADAEPSFAGRLREAVHSLQNGAGDYRRLWPLFFPEGVAADNSFTAAVSALRQERTIRIDALNPRPITDPGREILFTANILLTVPAKDRRAAAHHLDPELLQAAEQVAAEPQRFWYDHPIQMGCAPAANEALYGLQHLDAAVAFEKKRGTVAADCRLACLLSVSVTHEGLHALAPRYLRHVFDQARGFHHLHIHALTEAHTRRILTDVLLPAAHHYYPGRDSRPLELVFGVDGAYGRHYSLLKAIAAFWHVCITDAVRGTFKIDLDQVFPQPRLVAETGKSAFEHLMTPLWGARGTDRWERRVELGLLAGALVNEDDIASGLFTPDVRPPATPYRGEQVVFCSRLPQAVSTIAEMMTRYQPGGPLDGRHHCLQRVHVTGGTTGALVDSLRRYRPFTPTFIGRAEDQAYLLSVLEQPVDDTLLRYAHQPGLIMRHDKEGFAVAAIAAARTGKYIGDLLRIANFSTLPRCTNSDPAAVKAAVDPFTGCFISHLPLTIISNRLALEICRRVADPTPETDAAASLLALAGEQLAPWCRNLAAHQQALVQRYAQERAGWNLFYDLLDRLETDLQHHREPAVSWRRRARTLIAESRLTPP
jgi:hypothetical protein